MTRLHHTDRLNNLEYMALAILLSRKVDDQVRNTDFADPAIAGLVERLPEMQRTGDTADLLLFLRDKLGVTLQEGEPVWQAILRTVIANSQRRQMVALLSKAYTQFGNDVSIPADRAVGMVPGLIAGMQEILER